MSDGLRMKMYEELKENLKKEGIVAICEYKHPANGETIKILGRVLYKRLLVPNPWKDDGIAIHRRIINPKTIERIGGKIKKTWTGAPLTNENFESIFKILMNIARKENDKRNLKIAEALAERK